VEIANATEAVQDGRIYIERINGDRDRMAASVIRAIDQKPANTGGAHFSEGDLLRAG
jgi:hypothetical protein